MAQRFNIPEPTPPPRAVREAFDLDPFYQQWVDVGGFPIVASKKVSPYALKEAAWIVWQMIEHRRNVLLRAMVQNKLRLVVIAHTEMLTQIPDHSNMHPNFYWDKRARGLGSTSDDPTVSCSEENMLNYPGDPYAGEHVQIHEFAHALHWIWDTVTPGFDDRLRTEYDAAIRKGLWQGTYAGSNHHEYWAEGVQSWFNANWENTWVHNHVNTRSELKEYDPRLAVLLTEVFGDRNWRYTSVPARADQLHLQGFDPQDSPTFVWPPALLALHEELRGNPESTGGGRWVNLKRYDPKELPRLQSSRREGANTHVFIGSLGVEVYVYFIEPNGTERFWVDLPRNNMSDPLPTQAGALWLIKDKNGKDLAVYRAEAKTGRALIIGKEWKPASPAAEEVVVDLPIERFRTVAKPVPETGLAAAGPKIEGPWLWMTVPTGEPGGAAAAASGEDYLKAASNGSVTEKRIATNGATPGDKVGKKAWTPGRLAPTGEDNINQVVNATGLGTGNIEYHVAYGSIALNTLEEQQTRMYVGSDDAVKVWINGALVHNNPVDRGASNYRESFSVTLKKGKNLLLVAIYEKWGGWSGFFGFKKDAVYRILSTPIVHLEPGQRPPMYWVDAAAGTLHRLIGKNVETFPPRVQNTRSLAVARGKLYWAEDTGGNTGAIKRSHLDGSDVKMLATLQSAPTSLAVDAAKNKLYWTNARGRIQTLNLNGGKITNLLQNLEDPHNITLDTAGGKVYWTEANGRIRRANLNGKSVQNIASDLDPISGIAIAGNKLYWTEITEEKGGKIRRANLNGSNFGTLVKLPDAPTGIAIDAVGNKLYWTEAGGNIRRASLSGQNVQKVVSGLPAPAILVLGSVQVGPAAPANGSLVTAQTAIPDTTSLLANYPNPFNPETWIPYQLAKPSNVKITIYDTRGVVVRHLDLGYQFPGTYTSRTRAAYWDGRNSQGERVASGVYFYRLETDAMSPLRKMVILK